MAEQPGAGSPRARRLLRWGRSRSGRGGEGPADYDSPDTGEPGAEDRASSLRGIARTAGRIALWVFIGLVLIRGLGDVLSGAREQAAAPQPAPVAAFPGDAARAFAAGFARVYVGSPSARPLAPYLAQGLADPLGTQPARSRARVAQVSPARRDCSKLVAGMAKQVEAIKRAIGEPEMQEFDVTVRAALCFVDAEWSLFAKPFALDSVWIGWAKALGTRLQAEGTLAPEHVRLLARRVAEALPPA